MDTVALFRSTLQNSSLEEAQRELLENILTPPVLPNLSAIPSIEDRFAEAVTKYEFAHTTLPHIVKQCEVDKLLDYRRCALRLRTVAETRENVLDEIRDFAAFGPFEKLYMAIADEFRALAEMYYEYIENMRELEISSISDVITGNSEFRAFDLKKHAILAKYYLLKRLKSDESTLREAIEEEICAHPYAFIKDIRLISTLFNFSVDEIERIYQHCIVNLVDSVSNVKDLLQFVSHFDAKRINTQALEFLRLRAKEVLFRGVETFEQVAACPEAISRVYHAEKENIMLRSSPADENDEACALQALEESRKILVDFASEVLFAVMGRSSDEILNCLESNGATIAYTRSLRLEMMGHNALLDQKAYPRVELIGQHVIFSIQAASYVNEETKVAIYALAIRFGNEQLGGLSSATTVDIKRFMMEASEIFGDFTVAGCRPVHDVVFEALHIRFKDLAKK